MGAAGSLLKRRENKDLVKNLDSRIYIQKKAKNSEPSTHSPHSPPSGRWAQHGETSRTHPSYSQHFVKTGMSVRLAIQILFLTSFLHYRD